MHRAVLSPNHLLPDMLRQQDTASRGRGRTIDMRTNSCVSLVETRAEAARTARHTCKPRLLAADEVTAAEGVQPRQRGRAGLPVHVRRKEVLPRHRVPAGVRLHNTAYSVGTLTASTLHQGLRQHLTSAIGTAGRQAAEGHRNGYLCQYPTPMLRTLLLQVHPSPAFARSG